MGTSSKRCELVLPASSFFAAALIRSRIVSALFMSALFALWDCEVPSLFANSRSRLLFSFFPFGPTRKLGSPEVVVFSFSALAGRHYNTFLVAAPL